LRPVGQHSPDDHRMGTGRQGRQECRSDDVMRGAVEQWGGGCARHIIPSQYRELSVYLDKQRRNIIEARESIDDLNPFQ
jgi:hypothetical protein